MDGTVEARAPLDTGTVVNVTLNRCVVPNVRVASFTSHARTLILASTESRWQAARGPEVHCVARCVYKRRPRMSTSCASQLDASMRPLRTTCTGVEREPSLEESQNHPHREGSSCGEHEPLPEPRGSVGNPPIRMGVLTTCQGCKYATSRWDDHRSCAPARVQTPSPEGDASTSCACRGMCWHADAHTGCMPSSIWRRPELLFTPNSTRKQQVLHDQRKYHHVGLAATGRKIVELGLPLLALLYGAITRHSLASAAPTCTSKDCCFVTGTVTAKVSRRHLWPTTTGT